MCERIFEFADAFFVILVDLFVHLDALFCLTNHFLQHCLLFDYFLELSLPRGQLQLALSFLLNEALLFLGKALLDLLLQFVYFLHFAEKSMAFVELLGHIACHLCQLT